MYAIKDEKDRWFTGWVYRPTTDFVRPPDNPFLQVPDFSKNIMLVGTKKECNRVLEALEKFKLLKCRLVKLKVKELS